MDLKKIAAIAGKPGLYKILKPTRTGVVVESLDEKKKKMAVSSAQRVSVLKEVSIYTTDQEGSIILTEVLDRIYKQYPDGLPFTNKSSEEELRDFLEEIVPEYDRERVYHSDMKKLVSWYNTIQKFTPETLETLLQEEEEEEKQEEKEASSDQAEPLKSSDNQATTAAEKQEEKEEKKPVKEAKTATEPKEGKSEKKKTKSSPKPKSETKKTKASAKEQNTETQAESPQKKAKKSSKKADPKK